MKQRAKLIAQKKDPPPPKRTATKTLVLEYQSGSFQHDYQLAYEERLHHLQEENSSKQEKIRQLENQILTLQVKFVCLAVFVSFKIGCSCSEVRSALAVVKDFLGLQF